METRSLDSHNTTISPENIIKVLPLLSDDSLDRISSLALVIMMEREVERIGRGAVDPAYRTITATTDEF